MRINRNNYEAFFLDHLENNLSSEMEKELAAFLLLHPGLASELDAMRYISEDWPSVKSENFPDKQSLKKQELPISADEMEELLAKNAEGLLSESEDKLLLTLEAAYPFIASAKNKYAHVFLKAGNIEFPDKARLRFEERLDLSDDEMLPVAFHEGDLNDEQVAALELKLKSDESLRSESKRYQQIKLKPERVSFEGKDSLRRAAEANLTVAQSLIFAEQDGTISVNEQSQLDALLASDDGLLRERAMLSKMKLAAPSISYPDKSALKRKETLVISLRRIYVGMASAAAVVAVLFWMNFYGSGSKAEWALTPPQRVIKITASGNLIVPNELVSVASSPHDSVKKVKQEPEIAAIPESSEANVMRAFVIPTRMNTKDVGELLAQQQPNISIVFPKMTLVHQPSHDMPSEASNEMSAWSYLTRMATEKIEGTYANSLVERQVEKISTRTKEEVQFERVIGSKSDMLHLKLGKLDWKSDVKKRKSGQSELRNRIENLFDRILPN